MQSLPPAGSPFSSGPVWSSRPPSTAAGSPDRVDLATAPQEPLMKPTRKKETQTLVESPRPKPEQTRSSALSELGSRGHAGMAAGALFGAGLGPALLPNLEGPRPRGATATPNGWRVPANPSRTPVQPRDPFEILQAGPELGALRVVASSTGRIRALRLQWPEEFQEPAFSAQKAVFHDILTRLPADVVVHVVAEGLAAAALPALLAEWPIVDPGRIHIHGLHLHSTPEQLYEPMTMWARDGAILMQTAEGAEVLMLPRSFRGDGQVDSKLNRRVLQGTGAAPARLQQALPDLMVRRSSLSFEGGDVIASQRAVLLGGQSLAANMIELRLSREAVLEQFVQLMGVPVIAIEPQPEFHLDLGFTFLDEDTIAVADPGLSMGLVANRPDLAPLVQATRDKQLSEKYDRAARRLAELGYRICRLPNLCGLGLTTPYLTYNNVLLENYLDQGLPVKKVYLPVYDVPELDEVARETFRKHGFQVVDMPSARLSTKLWGAIRCATGDLRVTDG